MPQRIVVGGGRVGGTIVATVAARALHTDEAAIKVIDATGQHRSPQWRDGNGLRDVRVVWNASIELHKYVRRSCEGTDVFGAFDHTDGAVEIAMNEPAFFTAVDLVIEKMELLTSVRHDAFHDSVVIGGQEAKVRRVRLPCGT